MGCFCPSLLNRTLRESRLVRKHLLHFWRGVVASSETNRCVPTTYKTYTTNSSQLFNRSHLENTFNVNNSSSCKTVDSKVPEQTNSSNTVGVVFDIDGVLVRGRKVIDSAKEALSKLEHHNVPYMYLTNGGCETEEHKALSLEKHLGVAVNYNFFQLFSFLVFNRDEVRVKR